MKRISRVLSLLVLLVISGLVVVLTNNSNEYGNNNEEKLSTWQREADKYNIDTAMQLELAIMGATNDSIFILKQTVDFENINSITGNSNFNIQIDFGNYDGTSNLQFNINQNSSGQGVLEIVNLNSSSKTSHNGSGITIIGDGKVSIVDSSFSEWKNAISIETSMALDLRISNTLFSDNVRAIKSLPNWSNSNASLIIENNEFNGGLNLVNGELASLVQIESFGGYLSFSKNYVYGYTTNQLLTGDTHLGSALLVDNIQETTNINIVNNHFKNNYNLIPVLGDRGVAGAVTLFVNSTNSDTTPATVNIINNTFQQNQTQGSGAGLYFVNLAGRVNAQIEGNTFFANESSADGGSVYLDSNDSDSSKTAINVHNNTFAKSVVMNTLRFKQGGAIYSSSNVDLSYKYNIAVDNVVNGNDFEELFNNTKLEHNIENVSNIGCDDQNVATITGKEIFGESYGPNEITYGIGIDGNQSAPVIMPLPYHELNGEILGLADNAAPHVIDSSVLDAIGNERRSDLGAVELKYVVFNLNDTGTSFKKWNPNDSYNGLEFFDTEQNEYFVMVIESRFISFDAIEVNDNNEGLPLHHWTESKDGSGIRYFSDTNLGVDETVNSRRVYAHYHADEYSVTYDLNGGSIDPELIVTEKYQDGDYYIVTDRVPTKEHFTFKSWIYNKKEYTAGSQIQINRDDLVLVTNWTTKTYKVTYDLDGGTETIVDTKEYKFNDLAPVTKLTPTKENYQFLHWENNGKTYKANSALLIEGNMVLVAKWKQVKFLFDYDLNGGTGEISDGFYYSNGEKISITTATPRLDKHKFIGWLYEGTIYNGLQNIVISNKDIILVAQWERQYTVTYDLNGGRSSETIEDNNIYYANDVVKIISIVPIKDEHRFRGWKYQDVLYFGWESLDVVNEDIVLVADWYFVNTYQVQYDGNGGSVFNDDLDKYTEGYDM
ncbi:MAG: InlB B-repeat-containing protein [Acholeplasma sp.]|nr:InlB B-repeat-containing protein [Acholeplasma sp.]